MGIACDPVLVFAAPDPTNAGYSSNDLQAIRSYVTSIPLNESGDYPLPDNHAPAALKWVSAGQSDCAARLDITNKSGAAITVSAVGLQLSASPAPNPYHYAQLDPCSISPRFGPCFNNGALYDQGYIAQVQIGGGGTGASFQGKVDVGDPTDTTTPLPLILANGDVKSITVRIFAQDAQAETIYRVVPQLTVSDTTTHVVTFSGLTQTLVFATKSQISCYGLSGGAVVPSSQITYDPGYHSWC